MWPLMAQSGEGGVEAERPCNSVARVAGLTSRLPSTGACLLRRRHSRGATKAPAHRPALAFLAPASSASYSCEIRELVTAQPDVTSHLPTSSPSTVHLA